MSSHSGSAAPPGAAPVAHKRFEIARPPFTHRYDVKSESGNMAYYVDISVFTPNTPDLTVHEGPDSKSPIVAVCHMIRFSGHFKIGVGDPSRADIMHWEDLTKETMGASHYTFSAPVPMATGGSPRRSFSWKRTHSVGVDGMKPASLSNSNHKLVDGETGEILAIFTNVRGFTSGGVLQINVDYGRDFTTLVLVSCLSLYEKSRRRKHRSGGGSGGGG